ncbi:PREDICTED: putative ubiquitin-like-specific protease 1B [Camelina sativa]|uniref:Ubiquitin-like-specific protease 1B n=1 Tax=Camelina sativa TaxID=90675 RepID=A0ABM1QHY2_CAMSA|nr:PREDICTED: putative ubiquitin-like-specific protease 1B [Camelina sativa]
MAVVPNHGSRSRNRYRSISFRHSLDSRKKRTISDKPVSSSACKNTTISRLSLRQDFHTCCRGFLRIKLWVRASLLLKKKAARRHHRDDDLCSNHKDSKAHVVEVVDDRIEGHSSTDGSGGKKKLVEFSREPFLPLKEEEVAQVNSAFSETNRMKILVSHKKSSIQITGSTLQCLMPTQWLNDEVVNLYLELLKERETRDPQKFFKCHFFNTFFYIKLARDSGYNYQAVRRWTAYSKLGYNLIDCDIIFVPIHLGTHWAVAVINNREHKFMYFDSLNDEVFGPTILDALAKYLVDEVKDKNEKDIDVSSWDKILVNESPKQQNKYDCGMFMLKYIDFYSRGLSLQFSQKHMPYFRLRTTKEILRLQAD